MIRVHVDRDNVNDEFVIVRKLYKAEAENAAVDDIIMEIETSKTMAEIRSPASGMLHLAVSEGDEVAVGGLLFEVGSGDSSDVAAPLVEHALPALTPTPDTTQRTLSRAAQALAEQAGVDVNTIASRGWVTAADVAATLPRSPAGVSLAPPTQLAEGSATPAVSRLPFKTDRRSLRKRTESRNLQRANSSGTTSLIVIDVSVSSARLVTPPYLFTDSISDLVVFEGARLLRRYRQLNAFHVDERTIGFFDAVNFGITFDDGGNLKVLALQNADVLSLGEVQAGIERLLQLYESGAPIDEALLTSSTVTVSDLSRSQVSFMFPLLDSNQSLILGITRKNADTFGLHAAFDHRISEGFQVARYLGELRDRVVSYFRPAGATLDVAALRCSACAQSMQAEVSLGGRGLMKILRPDGSDGYLCRNCFRGW